MNKLTPSRKKVKVKIKYEWEWQNSGTQWIPYDPPVQEVLNSLSHGEAISIHPGQWSYTIIRLDANNAIQRNTETNKERPARRKTIEIPVVDDGTGTEKEKTPEPEFKIDADENFKDINSFYSKEIIEAKTMFDTATFDPEVYTNIPNSPE
eukprot:286397_1